MKLFLLLFLIISVPLANAQIVQTLPYEFVVGISGGSTFSSVTFNPKVVQGTINGLTFGLIGRMTMAENVGLQIELNYAEEGWAEKFEEQPEYRYERRLRYLQFPFYTRVQFGGRTVKAFVNAGPQIGYMLSEATDENLNGEAPGKVNAQHDMKVSNRFDWGLSGGAGVELRTSVGYFTIEGRYLYALGDIYSTSRADYFSKASAQTITAKVAYLFVIH
ncbi:MAG: PorT family protein [Tannerella sp.]|jgi:opacity protein-like surface antigen|nr:PorT family protein [Tannerella sp.]